jgi:hypothetical protein
MVTVHEPHPQHNARHPRSLRAAGETLLV